MRQGNEKGAGANEFWHLFQFIALDGPTEMFVTGVLHELQEYRTTDMNKIGMVAGLKVYVVTIFQVVVHHHFHVIRLTNGRNRA